MTDKKISELTSITGANVSDANDVLPIVDTSVATTKKITREELFKSVSSVDINGGTIDGTVIGGSTPAAISGTTGTFSGDVSIADKIVHTGDTNTALRFPAADTVTVETAGSERMRIDSSGNVGIGTSSPYAVNGKNLTVRDSLISRVVLENSSASGRDYYLGSGPSGDFNFYDITAATERMRIDASGNLLVGASITPQISAGSTGRLNAIAKTAADVAIASSLPSLATGISIRSQSVTAAGTGWVHFIGSSGNGTTLTANNIFIYGNGDIQNTNNSYGAISDVRVKENIADATPKLNSLLQVRVVSYNLIGDEKKQLGVIAQELEHIFPRMVEETPDRDPEGRDLGTTTKSVKYSVFVPMLIKALQEQQALIGGLEARIAALEAQP